MFLWSLLLTCSYADDTWKVTSVCYPGTGYAGQSACEQLEKMHSEEWWGASWEYVKDIYSNFVWASSDNAKTALKDADGYVVMVYVLGGMSGEGNDVFDLAAIKNRKVVFVMDTGLTSSSLLRQSVLKLAESQVKAIGKLKAKADNGEFVDGAELRKRLVTVLRRKHEKYMTQLHGNNTGVALQAKPGLVSTYGSGCHIAASGDIHSKVEALGLLPSRITLQTPIHVPYLYISFFNGWLTNPEYLNADYILTDAKSAQTTAFKAITFKDVGIFTFGVREVEFGESYWRVTYYYQGYTSTVTVNYDRVNGQFSVLAESSIDDVSVELTVSKQGGSIEIRGLNLSAQSAIAPGYDVGGLSSEPNLLVTFDPSWDEFVSNTPEIVLESSNPNAIQVSGQPSKASIRKTSIADRPKPGGPDNGPNVALIVGVVITVLVVVGIIVGVVVFIVMRKKKEQVHPEGETEREVPVPQATQQPPPSQPYQQPPPQYQYEQPPSQDQSQQPPSSQDQSQQPPSSQQYQQPPPQPYQQPPPPQWWYQQPPPQYMYQQPPETSGKHKKDKHKHKKDKKDKKDRKDRKDKKDKKHKKHKNEQ